MLQVKKKVCFTPKKYILYFWSIFWGGGLVQRSRCQKCHFLLEIFNSNLLEIWQFFTGQFIHSQIKPYKNTKIIPKAFEHRVKEIGMN